MNWRRACGLVVVALSLAGCGVSYSTPVPAEPFKAGFWYWGRIFRHPAPAAEPVDVLFVQVGTIQERDQPGRRWTVWSDWPGRLPAAREYWMVFRYERQGVPALEAAPVLADEVRQVLSAAQHSGIRVAGVQLDIDSPTAALREYARFLREVRKELPKGFPVSITALLDWFRSGTAIGEAIAETDEFVPQFYDLADPRDNYGGMAIAAKVDSARWGPVFNRFGKRFRVGVSTFGRSRALPRESPGARGPGSRSWWWRGNVAPLDFAMNRAFQLQAGGNAAGELVLTYRATAKTEAGSNRFEAGDGAQFILPTQEAVQSAVENVRRMGGHLAGVLFFRWPSDGEGSALQPAEALVAAGLRAPDEGPRTRVQAVDGGCAAVHCMDLYFESFEAFAPRARRFRVHASTSLDYFLPEKRVPVRMVGHSELELTLPPYTARGRLQLGRAVSTKPAEYTLEEEQ